MTDFWPWGSKSKLARIVGILPQTLNNVLLRKRGVSPKMAKRLGEASKRLGPEKYIPWTVWLANKTTAHPAFKKGN